MYRSGSWWTSRRSLTPRGVRLRWKWSWKATSTRSGLQSRRQSRIAQESITNVRRHARHATEVSVRVVADSETVSLTVSDDGDVAHFDADSGSGFGLVGMTERAALHDGTLEAGPGHDRGWTVRAVLPKAGRDS
ncbi:MAG: ATP-binding protein [Acidimicrobiia bacterium]